MWSGKRMEDKGKDTHNEGGELSGFDVENWDEIYENTCLKQRKLLKWYRLHRNWEYYVVEVQNTKYV